MTETDKPRPAFAAGDLVMHAENGKGRVVFATKDNVGIVYDNGHRGTYGSAYFVRFPSAIVGEQEVLEELVAEALKEPEEQSYPTPPAFVPPLLAIDRATIEPALDAED